MSLYVMSLVCLLICASVVKTQDKEKNEEIAKSEEKEESGKETDNNNAIGSESDNKDLLEGDVGDVGGSENKGDNDASSSGSCIDKATWCKETDTGNCYGEAVKTCCATCKKIETGNPDCKYGDQSSKNCAETLKKDKTYCDFPKSKAYCCGSCK